MYQTLPALALGGCAAVGLPTSRPGSRTSLPSSSTLWQVPHELSQLLFKFEVGITNDNPVSSNESCPQPAPRFQVMAGRPFHPDPSYLQNQRLHKADGARSPLVSVFWLCHLLWPGSSRRLGSPQLQSVPLAFKCSPCRRKPHLWWVTSPTGCTLAGKRRGAFNKQSSEPWPFLPKVKLLERQIMTMAFCPFTAAFRLGWRNSP